MVKPVLSVASLRIERGGTVILRDVDWRVQRGEHWVILGANGSGKTSLLSALTGYLMPTSGEVSLLGETYGESDWRELRKKIGLVSSSVRQMMADDEPALETVASGKYAMIDFWGRVSRSEKIQALKLLRQVECEYLAARPWQVLSQGERQRVFDWPRVDGETARFDFGRAMRGTGSGGARTFFTIHPAAWRAEKFADAGFGDASRRRNDAGVFARFDFEKWRGAGAGK